ncbi:MAG: hydroxymethylglutaryl-CoA synthase family protein [Candidatus Binatia bacterium]
MRDVGIESLSVYLPMYSLPLEELARARGVDPEKYWFGLGLETMALAPPWEDAVTLAANAAAPLFESGQLSRDEIGLLLVATESAVDHAKPVSIFVHELLRAQPACRTYELKHACYSGTAALMTAVQWIASGAARGRKALVIASDIARYDRGSAGEPTQGAGAVAMVVSSVPHQLAVDFRSSGSFAEGVFDFWRPLDRREALVDGQYSLDCYLRALEGAYADFRDAEGEGTVWQPIVERYRAFLYHVPFPKMAWKAHRRLLEIDRRFAASEIGAAESERLLQASFETAVSPHLAACRAIGNSYTASLYFCLAELLEAHGERMRGERVALFSYGSGCCAEFFTGLVGSGAGSAGTGVRRLLDARRPVTIEEYEAMRADDSLPDRGFSPPPGFQGSFYYAGTDRDRRRYLPVA